MATSRLLVLIACILGLTTSVIRADISYAAIPPCAISCIVQEIGAGHSQCAITNQTCMCHDTVLATYVQTCVMANCTVKEMLVAQNQSLAACDVPIKQHDTIMAWFRALLFGLPTFFIVARVANKYMKLSPWGWDDTTIVIAYLILAAFLPAGYLAEARGAGRDIWTVPFNTITDFLILFFVFQALYVTCLAFIKASILFLYLRIFPDETFRKVLWCTQIFGLLSWLAFFISSFFFCTPLHYFWDGWTGEIKGTCINLNAVAICHGALNVVMDLWMIILPATQVYNLRMPLQRKLGVMMMFSIGVFLLAVSAYRINALIVFSTSFNVTADSFESSLWSHIELCVGVFVACLPSTRQVWRILFPKLLEVTHVSKSSRSAKSAKTKGSNIESQASRTICSLTDRAQVLSYEEASIAHLIGDFNHIDLNDLPSEPDTPATPATPITPKTPVTPRTPPKTPKNLVEIKEEPHSGSSRDG
ncbi:CFEM domain-containing protein [Colletotrichum plurivorum]|uniref:CFEM domain-containing protein n=1 Tax=Colletotrichum plurivorum TaxID=2175906 RepID=A0A8H6NFS1_9PEZI|nr:CFEM domain-containing protein [Colletotrichum plurivorum]